MAEYKQPVNIPTPNLSWDTDPNTVKAGDIGKNTGTPRVSMGNPNANVVKSTGMVQRGCKNTTRGKTSRGPLA
jgi:hypothetical protein